MGEILNRWLGEWGVKENYRPDWLWTDNGGILELDFYIETLGIAIEVQGRQHAEFIEYFHGTEAVFTSQKQRDEDKRVRCQEHGIELLYVWDELDALNILDVLQRKAELDLVFAQPPLFLADVARLEFASSRKKISKVRYRSIKRAFQTLLDHAIIAGASFKVDDQERKVLKHAMELIYRYEARGQFIQ